MKKLEHIGIAVKNLAEANGVFAKLLGTEHYKIETVEAEGVKTSFFKVGDLKIELLEATREDSPIARWIEKRGEGLHHLAFEVKNIEASIDRCREQGFQLIRDKATPGADNKRITFLHPKSSNGVLVELCQEITAKT
ncbi:MAG: methylmalonyl-CoA epimerase [Cyclobacteriaceae bacterium]|nr:methylmalonyl-CoA epimerase [Cyclobacteriaceae bacterium]